MKRHVMSTSYMFMNLSYNITTAERSLDASNWKAVRPWTYLCDTYSITIGKSLPLATLSREIGHKGTTTLLVTYMMTIDYLTDWYRVGRNDEQAY